MALNETNYHQSSFNRDDFCNLKIHQPSVDRDDFCNLRTHQPSSDRDDIAKKHIIHHMTEVRDVLMYQFCSFLTFNI